jgi:methionyl-tRNA formyltransferase
LSPYPTAWCVFRQNEEWNVKIYDAKILLEDHDLDTGSMVLHQERNENCSRKFYSGSKFTVSRQKEDTTPEF